MNTAYRGRRFCARQWVYMLYKFNNLVFLEKPCYPFPMLKWLHKLRLGLAVLALGLLWHHVILAGHLACEVHPNCDEDAGQIFGSSSSHEHDHCLVQITPFRVNDTSIQDRCDSVRTCFSFAHVWPEAPRVVRASRTPPPLSMRSRAEFQFTHSVRIIS